jgi:disulfide bond formation protein DsbB
LNLFSKDSPSLSAVAIAALAFVTIAGAWGFQWAGHPPCDLCLEQRYAYYAGVPLALAIAAAALAKAPRAALVVGFALLTALFLYNAGLAVYHSGVEAKFWEGPTACTGGALPPAGDLLKQLDAVKVVRCDEVGLRVLGLTLANWNILVSAVLAALSAASALRGGGK